MLVEKYDSFFSKSFRIFYEINAWILGCYTTHPNIATSKDPTNTWLPNWLDLQPVITWTQPTQPIYDDMCTKLNYDNVSQLNW